MANTSNQNLHRIYRLQKQTARSIFDTDYKHPSLPLFVNLGIVRLVIIDNRIRYFRCLTVYKSLNNTVSYMSDILRHFSSVHYINAIGVLHLVYSNFHEYVLRNNAEKQTLAFQALKDQNFLSSEQRNAPTMSSLKAR